MTTIEDCNVSMFGNGYSVGTNHDAMGDSTTLSGAKRICVSRVTSLPRRSNSSTRAMTACFRIARSDLLFVQSAD